LLLMRDVTSSPLFRRVEMEIQGCRSVHLFQINYFPFPYASIWKLNFIKIGCSWETREFKAILVIILLHYNPTKLVKNHNI